MFERHPASSKAHRPSVDPSVPASRAVSDSVWCESYKVAHSSTSGGPSEFTTHTARIALGVEVVVDDPGIAASRAAV
jgi:hypothetical protein